MPNITPFKGVVYNRKKLGDLSKVVAPPYDIIPPSLQDALCRKSPYNFVRVELNKVKPSDDARDNRYTRSGKLFQEWLRNGVLVRDEKDSLYIYAQQYKDGPRTIERIGFIGLMEVDPKRGKKVLPHENTLLAPKMDRLNLMRSVRANLSPIFVLYDDPSHEVRAVLKAACGRKAPYIDVRFEGARNRAWRLDDPAAIRKIVRAMRSMSTFIADGHHRYEVSRMYREEMRNASAGLKKAAGYVMVYFVESAEDMLTVLPAHRAPKDIGGLGRDEILRRLAQYFSVKKAGSLGALMKAIGSLRKKHAFGVQLGKGAYYVIVLKDEKDVDAVIKDKPKAWRQLDVSILHMFIFRHVLGIRDDDDNIEFIKSPEEAARSVGAGTFPAAFFLNPTKVSQVKSVAKLGERMPRKATYFYPKPLSGIVINKH